LRETGFETIEDLQRALEARAGEAAGIIDRQLQVARAEGRGKDEG
jgi:hypothetical protein